MKQFYLSIHLTFILVLENLSFTVAIDRQVKAFFTAPKTTTAEYNISDDDDQKFGNYHDNSNSSKISNKMKLECTICRNPNSTPLGCGVLGLSCCDCPAGQYSYCGSNSCFGCPGGITFNKLI